MTAVENAVMVVRRMKIPQSQESLTAQAAESMPMLTALGCNDLADFVQRALLS